MSQRHRRYSIHEVIRTEPLLEKRRPELYRLYRPRKTTVTFETKVHSRRRERVERSTSPLRHRRKSLSSSPPPLRRLSSLLQETSLTMSTKNSPTLKQGFIPLPDPIPKAKKEDERKVKTLRSTDKPYVKNHKKSTSYDTGYGSGANSPFEYEDRSPFDYSPKNAKPRADKEAYEIINGKPRTSKYISTKTDTRYISRKPASLNEAEEYVPQYSSDPYKDRYKEVKKTAKVLQEKLMQEVETATFNFEAAKQEEGRRLAEIDSLQAELAKMKLHKQLAEGRAAEAEKKLKQQQINELEQLERKLQEQQADALETRERELRRREEEFARKQWDEIEALPSPIARRGRQLPPIIDQEKKPKRTTTLTTTGYNQSALTTAGQSQSVLATAGNPFMSAIFEAQRDYDDSLARGESDRRRGTEVKYSSTRKDRPRRDSVYK